MRVDAQLTIADAATRLDRSRSSLGRIEKAETRADTHFVRSAMDEYDTYDPDALELARAAMQPGWWEAYGATIDELVSWETDAARVREVAPMRLPVLLQTEDYSRAVLESRRGEQPCAQLEDELAVRQIRQRRLTDTGWPLALTALVDESALHKSVGGTEVMRTQLRHLLNTATGDSVTILVLPDSLGVYEGMGSAFTVLEFEDDQDPDIMFLGTVIGPRQLNKAGDITGFARLFDDLRSLALSRTDSVNFIEQLGRQLYGV